MLSCGPWNPTYSTLLYGQPTTVSALARPRLRASRVRAAPRAPRVRLRLRAREPGAGAGRRTRLPSVRAGAVMHTRDAVRACLRRAPDARRHTGFDMRVRPHTRAYHTPHAHASVQRGRRPGRAMMGDPTRARQWRLMAPAEARPVLNGPATRRRVGRQMAVRPRAAALAAWAG